MSSRNYKPNKKWLDISAIGSRIEETRFIAFKAPLKQSICQNLLEKDQFNLDKLFEDIETNGYKLGLIIDLTNADISDKYYDPMELESRSVQYVRLRSKGHGTVPDKKLINKFKEQVDDFLSKNKNNDLLIGVHCTHGRNRTGYFICRYMIDVLNVEPNYAIQAFKESRGHSIDRANYVKDLLLRSSVMCKSDLHLNDSKSDYENNDEERSTRQSNNNRTCYNCGKHGHFARECLNWRNSKGNVSSSSDQGDDFGSKNRRSFHSDRSSGGRGLIRCYYCGEGHFSRSCSNRQTNCYDDGGSNGDRSEIKCNKCDELGHFARICTKVRNDRM